MKKFLSICFLWAICIALWGQTNGNYGGDFNPDNPSNPQEPSVTMKYDFKVTAGKGGTVNKHPSDSQFSKGTQIQLNANPNSGYTFKYWMEDNKVISSSQWYYYTMPGKDVEIMAVFAFEPDVPANPDVIPLDYKVTVEAYPSRGGSVDCDRNEVKVGSYTYVSASPYNGYKFKGWAFDGKVVSNDSYYHFEMEKRNMHFTALFEFDPNSPNNPTNNPNGAPTYLLEYTIDGQVCYTEHVPEGAALTAIATPTKEGYTFSGWSGIPATMPAKDITVIGSFTANVYGVTYVLDGKVFKVEEVAYGAGVPIPEVPAKEGHTFSGWDNVLETMLASDVTIGGTFTVNKYIVTFKIGDKVIASDLLEFGATIVVPDIPEKEGHSFCGWGEVAGVVPANDVIYEGAYSVNTYNVYYYVGDKLIHIDEVAYGETIPEYIYDLAEEGSAFLGWVGEDYKTMPACDVTYIANIDTAIDLLKAQESDTTIYDLKGRRVNKDEVKGGLYIVNGKKVLIK